MEMKCGNAYVKADNVKCRVTDKNCVCPCWFDVENCPAYKEPREGKTVREIIVELHIEKLEKYRDGAHDPWSAEKYSREIKALRKDNTRLKIKGIARKHCVAEERVKKVERRNVITKAYSKKGQKDVLTSVLKITLMNDRVYYYDWYSNQIASDLIEFAGGISLGLFNKGKGVKA